MVEVVNCAVCSAIGAGDLKKIQVVLFTFLCKKRTSVGNQ